MVSTSFSAAPTIPIWRRTILAYGAALVLSLLIVVGVMRLWRADLHTPLVYNHDSLTTQALIQGVIEGPWYWHIDRLGAPTVCEMYDYPLADNLHFLIMKLIGMGIPDSAYVFNLYLLLTFPLTTLTSLLVLRNLKVSYSVAVAISLLYTFIPYHFFRGLGYRCGEHLLLAAYYLVPLMVLVILWVYLDAEFLWQASQPERRPRPHLWQGKFLIALLICILTGSAGVYYAFFACYLLVIAGLAASLSRQHIYPLITAAILIAAITGTAVANILPSLVYWSQEGPNPVVAHRDPFESEIFGLKIMQMVLPMTGHRIQKLADFKDKCDSWHPLYANEENRSAALGVVACAGLALLLGRLLVSKSDSESPPVLDALARLTVFAVLLGVVGGFGAVVSWSLFSGIRCYSRISVYIAFFCLLGVALFIDKLYRWTETRPRWRCLGYALVILILGVGLFDQTSRHFIVPYAQRRAEYASDRDFFQQVESKLSPGAMIFQMPVAQFPEYMSIYRMWAYDHLRGYLHSRSLRWSYGAIKGRATSLWIDGLYTKPFEEMMETLAAVGFAGVYIDRYAFADQGTELEQKLARLLVTTPLVSKNNRFAFFPMTKYIAAVRRQYNDAAWQARREQALHPVLFAFREGFYDMEGTWDSTTWHWCSGRGELRIVNPTAYPKRISLKMGLRTLFDNPAHLRVESSLFSHEMDITRQQGDIADIVTVPPGTHTVHFYCDGAPYLMNAPADTRKLVFRVMGLSVRELDLMD